MARTRSPNYPYIGLPAAIERVKKIEAEDHRNRMSRDVVAKHLGFGSLNGIAVSVISALVKYGLLESIDNDLRVSQDAIAIIVDSPDSQDHQQALRRAAFKPDLFNEVHKHFGGQPTSETNLIAYLRKKEFTANAAVLAARAYRETMELVSGQTGSSDATVGKPAEDSEMEAGSQPDKYPTKQSVPGLHTIFHIRLKDGTIVRLDASGEVNSSHAEAIKGLIDLTLGVEKS